MAKENHKPYSNNIPNEETLKAIEEVQNDELEEIINLDEWLDDL